MDAKEMIQRAKIKLMFKTPFFSNLAMQFEYREDKRINTMSTNGEVIMYNPEFVATCYENDSLCGALVHEVLHVVLLHPARRKNRDVGIWNAACDYAVNSIIRSCCISLPSGVLIDSDFANMSAEEIYNRLLEDVEDNNNAYLRYRHEQDWGEHDNWEDAKEMIQGNKSRYMAKIKSSGTMPKAMEREFEAAAGVCNWKTVLARFLEYYNKDYNFIPPDTRFQDVLLPGFHDEDISDNIVLAVDTSASISDRLLGVFMAEVYSIISCYPDIKGYFGFCDTRLYRWEKFDSQTKLPVPQGGGGTSFIPVFMKIEEEHLTPRVLIYFTDGYGTFPSKPLYPVIWAMSENRYGSRVDVPFGMKIIIREF